jgi:sugar phosphate permease
VFLGSVVFFSFPVLFVPLTEEFGWSRTSVASAYGALTLCAGVSAPFLGALADRSEAKSIAGISLVALSLAFGSLVVLTPYLGHLYLVFACAGVATTGTSVVVYARAIASWFGRARNRTARLRAAAPAAPRN